MSKIQLNKNFIKSSCKLALNEDLYPSGDITSELINKNIKKKVKMISNQKGILGGIEFAKETFKLGGGTNHRFNLSDEYLIKDNHISSEKNFENLIQRAIKKKGRKKITVEVDNLSQLKRVLGLKFDRILLDNMNSKYLKKAVIMSK